MPYLYAEAEIFVAISNLTCDYFYDQPQSQSEMVLTLLDTQGVETGLFEPRFSMPFHNHNIRHQHNLIVRKLTALSFIR